jgi:Protein of unknown function, DUF481
VALRRRCLDRSIGSSALAFVLAITTVCAAKFARAQVNTEPLRKKLREKGGWVFNAQMNFTARTGNTEGIDFGGSGGVGFRSERQTAFVFGNGEYTNYNGTISVENAFVHARYDYRVLSFFWDEAFLQAQTDFFQRIKLRNLAGVGPRFGLYQSKAFDVFAGTSYMFERDVVYVLPGVPEVSEYTLGRWNNYVSVDYLPDKRVELATTAYIQPAFADFGNYRFLSETTGIFKVTKVLAAQVTLDYHYDSRPPLGALPDDLQVVNSLTVTF